MAAGVWVHTSQAEWLGKSIISVFLYLCVREYSTLSHYHIGLTIVHLLVYTILIFLYCTCTGYCSCVKLREPRAPTDGSDASFGLLLSEPPEVHQ